MKTKGFTLVEIMIVVGVIALLATMTIPQMMRSRLNANEVATIGNMRALYHGCIAYNSMSNPHVYPDNLTDLTAPVSTPPYINQAIASATSAATVYQGYYFAYTVAADKQSFGIIAWPASFGRTGTKNFFVGATGRVTYTSTDGEEPDANSPPIEY